MKAEISQIGLFQELRFSGVFQQQGRMLADRDWNELCEILRHLGNVAASEAIGTGVPRHDGLIASPGLGSAQLSLRNSGGFVAAQGVIGEVRPRPPAPPRPPAVPRRPASVVGIPLLGASVTFSTGDILFWPPPVPKLLYLNQRDLPDALRAIAADVAQVLLPAPPAGRLLYVDIWDRTVNAFEIDALLDPALHGADTCVRTQRMAQIKAATPDDVDWTTDPCNPSLHIPGKGDGIFDAQLTAAGEAADDCDPCADQVSIKRSVANQLFRLEVHSVRYDAQRKPSQLILKWSRDNGAREFKAGAALAAPDRSHEFFSNAHELLLGMPSDDWSGDEALRRGVLDPADPVAAGAAFPRVREWDGWCQLDRTGTAWAVTSGRYAKVPLGVFASMEGGRLKVLLDDIGITFSLVLADRQFLTGDYWLALMRTRAVDGARLRVVSTTPLGVEHRYCVLGVAAAGDDVTPLAADKLSPSDLRRLQHPALTCLDASDVGYLPDCPNGLFKPDTHNTVKKALDQICKLDAAHVAFTQTCNTSVFGPPGGTGIKTVDDALKLLCNVSAGQILFDPKCNSSIYRNAKGVKSVDDALKLLCDVTAEQIRFDPDCKFLRNAMKESKSSNVRDALEALCGRGADTIAYSPQCEYLKGKGVETIGAALDALCKREPAKPDLLRIKDLSWANDQPMPVATFERGLTVTFTDDIRIETMTGSVFIVTLETTVRDDFFKDVLTPLILAGTVTASANGAVFVPGNLNWLRQALAGLPTDLRAAGLRVRVRLIGRGVNDAASKRMLDGFVPMKAQGSGTPQVIRLALDLHNAGIGAVSDFESWFFVISDSVRDPTRRELDPRNTNIDRTRVDGAG